MSAAEILDETGTDRKSAALELLARGFHVLAVKANEKRPDPLLAAEGFKNASRDAETVGGWLDVKPRCNLGIACGAEYGLAVLDVDTKNDARGMQTLQALGAGEVLTLTANTPSGGLHLYFRHPGVRLKAKLDGIDVKGADGGGYVLAPPSTLPNGAYAWRDAEIPVAEMPAWLLDELRAGKPIVASSATGPVASITIPEGQRHNRLVELGAVYRGKGLSEVEIETLLWEHARRYFDPPFSPDNPADVREVEAVVRWYGGKAAPTAAAADLKVMTTAELIAAADAAPPVMLLDPLVREAGSLMIYGVTGHGKSHLGLSLALALAEGRSILSWTVGAPVPVLFADGEMALADLRDRLVQYLADRPSPVNLHWAAAFAQNADMPDLADVAGQAKYLGAIEASGARVAVFDNLSCLRTATLERPENSVEAWTPVAAFFRELRHRGVAVVLIHHAGKSGSQRGSSAHVIQFDTVVRVALAQEPDPRAELDVEIEFEKHRHFNGEAAQSFRAKVFGDCDGFATWEACGADPLVDDVVRLRQQGIPVRKVAELLKRSRKGVEKAITRAQARGLLPLKGDADA